jgi:hypothetical protein
MSGEQAHMALKFLTAFSLLLSCFSVYISFMAGRKK